MTKTLTLRIIRSYHRFMRSRPSGLFPVFRSMAQAEILAALLLYPTREQTISQLSQSLDIPLATVSDEAARLVEAGLLQSRKIGRANLLKPNADNRFVRPLTEIVLGTVGPHRLVSQYFAELEGIEQLLIYGSWAARYSGVAGAPPHDLDLLIVGSPNRAAVYEAAEAVEKRIGMPVNPVIVSRRRWTDAKDPLMLNIKASPTFEIDVPDGELIG